jgi:small-conductance mechanosensitive channel
MAWQEYLNMLTSNGLSEYTYAIGVFLVSLLVLRFFKYVFIKKLEKFFAKTATDFDDIVLRGIDAIGWPFYILLSFYFGIRFLTLPGWIDNFVTYVIIIVGTYYAVKFIQIIINYALRKIIEKREKQEGEDADTSMIDLLGKILKAVLWVVAALLILTNLGYNIGPLVAGLGIGGIAIAFALQNVLTDIFASFSIYFDKPFQKGDYIVVGADSGTVKNIGIKSTRIQTLQGEELVMSNKELTETRVRNYKKMKRRRIAFSFGVTYETSVVHMKKIPGIVDTIFKNINVADLDRVHFKEFADSSLNYEVVYFLNSKEYKVYMDTQQIINLAIKAAFEKERIDMAYPTRTVYMKK